MRIPQVGTFPRQPLRTSPSQRATQPSTPASPMRTTGPQGTLGGKAKTARRVRKAGGRGGMKIGQEGYLWILVAIEIAVMCCLRKYFRRYHGG